MGSFTGTCICYASVNYPCPNPKKSNSKAKLSIIAKVSFISFFLSIIDHAKAIHIVYVDDVEPYLSHPINTFHLSKRLTDQWKAAVHQIMDTDTCVKGNYEIETLTS